MAFMLNVIKKVILIKRIPTIQSTPIYTVINLPLRQIFLWSEWMVPQVEQAQD